MFTEIHGPSTFGSYNVHNVLAGSNILIWVCFVGLGGFPKPKTQVLGWGRLYCYVKKQILPNIELSTMSMCFKGMLFFTFHKVLTCPFHAYVLSSPFVTISQLEMLSYNIVLLKHITQCSNQFLTDPN